MKPQEQLACFVFIILLAWVDCADVASCASMKSWFPGTYPQTFADNLPYELSVTGYIPDGEAIPRYTPESSHTVKGKNTGQLITEHFGDKNSSKFVYLNGSLTADQKMRRFIGFIVYAENSVKSYDNGRFVPEDFPEGVEAVNCSSLQLVQNSTSDGNWTSLKLIWKPPKDYRAGNITFSASVLLQTNPPIYYEGFKAQLRYACLLRKCVACPGMLYKYDSYGCRTCQCSDSCDIVCAEIYSPVCGTDGKTYSNKCSMEREACEQKKNITVASVGECGNSCDIVCAEIYSPVCGTDGKTYSNKCSMEREACEQKKNITVASVGECGSGCDFVCATVHNPVCGMDGETYRNECFMKSKACEEKSNVSVAHTGECMATICSSNGCCENLMVQRIVDATLLIGGIIALDVFAVVIAIQWRRLVKNGASRLGFPCLSFMFSFLAFLWFSV